MRTSHVLPMVWQNLLLINHFLAVPSQPGTQGRVMGQPLSLVTSRDQTSKLSDPEAMGRNKQELETTLNSHLWRNVSGGLRAWERSNWPYHSSSQSTIQCPVTDTQEQGIGTGTGQTHHNPSPEHFLSDLPHRNCPLSRWDLYSFTVSNFSSNPHRLFSPQCPDGKKYHSLTHTVPEKCLLLLGLTCHCLRSA